MTPMACDQDLKERCADGRSLRDASHRDDNAFTKFDKRKESVTVLFRHPKRMNGLVFCPPSDVRKVGIAADAAVVAVMLAAYLRIFASSTWSRLYRPGPRIMMDKLTAKYSQPSSA